MNSLNIKILRYLVKSDNPQFIKNIAKYFGISQRNLRYRLDQIDSWLKENKFSLIIRKPNYGIFIDRTELDFIENSLQSYGLPAEVVHSKDKRLLIIFYSLLLSSKESTKISDLEKLLNVSRSTTNNDLKDLRLSLQYLNISIVSQNSKGLRIVGDEYNIRIFCIYLLSKVQTDRYIDVLSSFFELHEHVFNYLDQDIFNIKNIVDETEKSADTTYADYAKEYFIVYLFIMLKRVEKGENIYVNLKDQLPGSKEQEIGRIIQKKIESCFFTKIEELEFLGIVRQLQMMTVINQKENICNENFLELLGYKLIYRMSDLDNFPYYKDLDLSNLLKDHIRPMIFRLRYQSKLENPLLKKIKHEYLNLFNTTKIALNLLEEYFQKKISEDDIAYFTLYFASSREKLGTQLFKPKKVVLVCATGNAISRLLEYRLKKLFLIEIDAVIAQSNICTYLNTHECDLLISTVQFNDINNFIGTEIVYVEPILTKSDIDRLSQYFSPRENIQTINTINSIKHSSFSLLELLEADSFVLDLTVETWQEGCRASGKLLENKGAVSAGYTQEMINTTNEFGDYIVISPLVALFHAKSNIYVNFPAMSFIRLKNAVSFFNNKQAKEVKYLFALCTTNKEIHQKGIRELGKLLDNNHFINSLDKITDFKSFEKIISKILNNN